MKKLCSTKKHKQHANVKFKYLNTLRPKKLPRILEFCTYHISTSALYNNRKHKQNTNFKFNYHDALRPRQNARYFVDDIFKFFNENSRILIQISLKLVPRCPVYHNLALYQIMFWRWTDDKSLSETMMSLLTDIYKLYSLSINQWRRRWVLQ